MNNEFQFINDEKVGNGKQALIERRLSACRGGERGRRSGGCSGRINKRSFQAAVEAKPDLAEDDQVVHRACAQSKCNAWLSSLARMASGDLSDWVRPTCRTTERASHGTG